MAKTFKQFISEAKSSEPTHKVSIMHNIKGDTKDYHVNATDETSAKNKALRMHRKNFPTKDYPEQTTKRLLAASRVEGLKPFVPKQIPKENNPTHTVKIMHNIKGDTKDYHVNAGDEKGAVDKAVQLHKTQFPETDVENQNHKRLTSMARVSSFQK